MEYKYNLGAIMLRFISLLSSNVENSEGKIHYACSKHSVSAEVLIVSEITQLSVTRETLFAVTCINYASMGTTHKNSF